MIWPGKRRCSACTRAGRGTSAPWPTCRGILIVCVRQPSTSGGGRRRCRRETRLRHQMSGGPPTLAGAAAANGSVGPGSPPLEELSEEEDEEEDSIEGSPEYFKRRAKQVRASGFFRPMAAAALPQLFHSRTERGRCAFSRAERAQRNPAGRPARAEEQLREEVRQLPSPPPRLRRLECPADMGATRPADGGPRWPMSSAGTRAIRLCRRRWPRSCTRRRWRRRHLPTKGDGVGARAGLVTAPLSSRRTTHRSTGKTTTDCSSSSCQCSSPRCF